MLRLAAFFIALSLGLPALGQSQEQAPAEARRHSPSDLEILVFDRDGQHSSSIFLSRTSLARLPQKTFRIYADESLPKLPTTGALVTGVDLDTLIHSLKPSDPASAAIAICRDGYTSPFPRQAILAHHPILALTIDGLTPHQWAVKHHAYDPSPYFVTYTDFVPSFHLLAHADFPQHPAEIIRLKIVSPGQIFAAITPINAGQLPADSPVLTGLHIAQQNCFRCHNSGDTGGTKADRSWQHLAEVAKSRPDYFASWVHNPQAIDPKASMYPNLQYDQPTLNALTRYFQTLAP